MIQRRSRLLMMSVLGTALVAAGCALGTAPKVGGSQTETTSNSGGLQGTNGSSANVTGTVKAPAAQLSTDGKSPAKYAVAAVSNYKGVVSADVTLRDYLGQKIVNSPSVKTDGNGKYSLTKVPPEQSCFVTADYGGVRLANMVSTVNKKTLTVNLTLGTTVACAALIPLFTADEVNKIPASPGDINPTQFENLVKAIEAVLTDSTAIKPKAALKDMFADFKPLLNNAEVKKAYDAITADVKAKGKTYNPNPTTATDKPASDATQPDGKATDSTQPATSATSVVDPGTTPKTYDPIKGTLERVGGTNKIGGSMAVQPITMTLLGKAAIAVPDNDKLWAIQEDGTIQSVPSSTLGQAYTDSYALANNGTTIYTIATVDGAPSVITLTPNGLSYTPTVKALSGLDIGRISGLVWSAEKSALIGADYNNQTIVTIKPDTGAVALYAGKLNDSLDENLSTGNLTDARFKNPASLAKDGSKLYVADFAYNRIFRIDLATNKIKLMAGGADAGATGLKNGPLSQAKFNRPIGLWLTTNGSVAIAEQNNNAYRQMRDADDEVRSFVTTTNGDPTTGQGMVSFPRVVAEMNNKLYFINSANEVYRFTRNP